MRFTSRTLIRSVCAAAAVAVITGCARWPAEYQGVSIPEVHGRVNAAYTGTGHQRKLPEPCRTVIYKRSDRNAYAPPSEINETWVKCLDAIDRLERWATLEREAHLQAQAAKEKAAAERVERERARRQHDLEKYGPEFWELYEVAYREGADRANKIFQSYGRKTRFHSLLVIRSCTGNICMIEMATERTGIGRGMKGYGFDMISKGIRAAPGTPLSEFTLVRFEEYGQGLYRNPIAVFRRSSN